MIEAFPGELGVVPGLGQDETALNDGLRVAREAFGCPVARNAAVPPRGLDVGLQGGGMAEDASCAGVANVGRTCVDLLRQGSDQAGGLGQIVRDDRLAESDIGQDAIQSVGRIVIWRGGEEAGRRFRPELGRRDPESVLAAEVMEERPLRDGGRPAEVIDGGGGEALGADGVAGRLEKPDASAAAFGRLFGGPGPAGYIPNGLY